MVGAAMVVGARAAVVKEVATAAAVKVVEEMVAAERVAAALEGVRVEVARAEVARAVVGSAVGARVAMMVAEAMGAAAPEEARVAAVMEAAVRVVA